MKNYGRIFGIVILSFFVFSACFSTTDGQSHNNEETANMTWQQRILNKFSFHTERAHRAERKLQESYELEEYLAQKKADEKKQQ